MARAYSGVLGSFALCLTIVRGLWLDLHADYILTAGLVVFPVFAATGLCIGLIADRSVHEHEENRFRAEMACPNMAATSKSPTSMGR